MARTYTHVIAFRTTAAEHRQLQALRSTFPEMGWGEMFRWLMDQPDVQATVASRVSGAPAYTQPFGIEASLPAGDR